MKRTIAILTVMIALTSISKAQDYHFSQFFDTPLLVNPALTGVFNGNQRAILYYRDQWSSVMTNPYRSFGFSFDTRVWKNANETGYLSLGLNAMKDKAGTSELSITQGLLSLAYHQQIGMNSLISAGIQGGFTQRTINTTNLVWDNQYDPNIAGFDPTLSSGETYIYEGFNHADLATGILYSYFSPSANSSSNNGMRFNIGGSFYHFNRPKKSFSELTDLQLYSKVVVHARALIGLSQTNTAIAPSFMYELQGPNQEIMAGLGFRFMLQEQSRYTGFMKESALTLGCLTRIGDAIIPYLSFEFANYAIGVSYDTNISGLRRATNSVGGFEVNLRFINPNPFKYQSRSMNKSFL
jgi:type IX secretion system PorP/SprF family membrane protein